MFFIIAIIMGLIVGAVAKVIMLGRDPGAIVVTVLLALAGCSAIDHPPAAAGHSGPAPGISYRVRGDDTASAYAQAQDYCKTHGDKTAKLDKLGEPQGDQRVAAFSCR